MNIIMHDIVPLARMLTVENIPMSSKSSFSMLANHPSSEGGLPLSCLTILPLTCTLYGIIVSYCQQGPFQLLVPSLICALPGVPVSLVSLVHPALKHLVVSRLLLYIANIRAPT
jgi:hypothetical protein